MKIKNLIIAAALLALTPAFASAQYYEYAGREGKAMAAGEMFWKWIQGKNSEKSAAVDQTLKDLKNKADAQPASRRVVKSSASSLRRFERAEQAGRSQAYAAAQKSRAEYRKFIESEVAKIPAEEKARYDAMAKAKNWQGLEEQIKWFAHSGNPKFSYDADRYYILQAVVKVDGKGLVSFGSLRIAQAIMSTTDKFKSYAYKEAEKVQRSISNSGRAL